MTPNRINAAEFAVAMDKRNSKNDHIVFDLLDTQLGGGARFVATRQPDGRLVIEVKELGSHTEFKVWKDEPLPFERWEVSPGMTIDDWRAKTTEEIVELVGGVEEAWQNHRVHDDHGKQNQMEEPWQGLLPPLGTIAYDPICNDFEVLLRLDTETVETAEPEDGIMHHATYKQYLKWARFGLQPPPMSAWDHVNSQGELGRKIRTGGRRRTLAAQEAGRRGLVCWWSPTSFTGVAKWRLEDDDPQVGYYRERHRQWTRRSQNGQGGTQ